MRFFPLLALLILVSCSNPSSTGTTEKKDQPGHSTDALRDSMLQVISTIKANVGVAIIGPDGDTLSINGDHHFAMMSVAKFPQALTLLHMVDEENMKIDEPLHFTEADLKQRTFSSLTKDHPEKNFDLSIEEALGYSIGQSDNITSNVIFAREGGPLEVERYAKSEGITDIGVGVDYWHLNDETADSNWTTPKAMAELLKKFHATPLLKEDTRSILWNAMVNGPTGMNRIKGLLPPGTIVAHKTGTGNTNNEGVIKALNDVGIVQLPDGKHLYIAVFVGDSREKEEGTADIIAQLSKLAWTHYSGK